MSQYTLQFKQITSTDGFNTHNLEEYTPYYYDKNDNIMYIDEEWYSTLFDITKKRIDIAMGHFNISLQLIKIAIPHNHKGKRDYENIYYSIYYAHIYETNYEVWSNAMNRQNIKCVKLCKMDIKSLMDMCSLYFGELTNEYIEDELSLNLISELNDTIKAFNNNGVDKLFIKLSGCSGKNYRGIYPCKTVLDIIKYITHDKLRREYDLPFCSLYNVDVCIIIMPWKEYIADNLRYEFRLFMHNDKITCASQQLWFKKFMYTDNELNKFGELLKSFKNDSIYKDAVIDAFLNIKEMTIDIIEYGPFGSYGPAGSALFRWDIDRDKIYNENNIIYVRYLI